MKSEVNLSEVKGTTSPDNSRLCLRQKDGVETSRAMPPEALRENDSLLMIEIIEALSALGGVCIRRNVGKFRSMRSERVVTCGLPGEADINYYAPGGKTFFLEVKTRSGTVSKRQEKFLERMRQLGFTAEVVRSVKEAVSLVDG